MSKSISHFADFDGASIGMRTGSQRLYLGGGQVGHKKKQQRVRRDVQVEIDQAMHEEAVASHQPGELQGPGKRIVELMQSFQGLAKQDAEKPGTAEPSENAGFGEGLEVVVVRVVDDFSIVERFVTRINDLQSAKPRSDEGMMEEDLPGVPAHGGSLSGGGFEGLERRKTLQDLFDTEPGDHKKRQEQHSSAGKQLLPHRAPLNEHQRQYGQLNTETHNASPGDREEKRDDGNNSE